MNCRICDAPAVRNMKCKAHLNPVLPMRDWTPADQAKELERHQLRLEAERAAEYLRRPDEPTADAPLVLIPCGSAKAKVPSRPAELYVSSHFRLAARAALALTTPGRVLILSARHGLIRYDSDELLAPYDQTIVASNSKRDAESPHRDRVRAQRVAWRIDPGTRAIGLLPQRYTRVARAAFPDLVDLLAGSRGIGDQRARLLGLLNSTHDVMS